MKETEDRTNSLERGDNVQKKRKYTKRGTSGDRGSTCTGNDPSWYAHNPELVNSAANLFFSEPLGSTIGFGSSVDPSDDLITVADTQYDTIPGIYTIGVIPTPGMASDAASVVNVAANNVYSFIRHANSGHSNYDAPDLMMYITAMDSAYACLAHLIRIYGIINYYDAMNKYVPDAMLMALGVLPETMNDATETKLNLPAVELGKYLRTNKANILTWINVLIAKLSARNVPGNLDLFKRHAFMYSGIWKDSNSFKSQLYAYVPEGFWEYSGYADSTGGQCIWKPYRYTQQSVMRGLKFTDLMTLAESLVNALLADEDMGIMSGDILKAYGDGGVYHFSMLPQEFTLVPSYDESVLSQIENTTLMGLPMKPVFNPGHDSTLGFHYPVLKQDPNTNLIHFNCQLWSPAPSSNRVLLNCRMDSPTPLDTLYHSRAMSSATAKSMFDGSGVFYGVTNRMDCFGTEICTTGVIYYLKIDTNGDKLVNMSRNIVSSVGTTKWGSESVFGKTWATLVPSEYGYANVNGDAMLCDQFDWHPIFRTYTVTTTAGHATFNFGPVVGDVDNYALVDKNVLKRIHEVATISLYDLPAAK